MIKVVNKKTHKPTPDDFYIGRGSVMGNPYHHKESDHPQALYKVDTVEEAIDKYADYLREKVKNNDEDVVKFIRNIINREINGNNTNFVCYCSPSPCHGNVIKSLIETIKHDLIWNGLSSEKLIYE